MPSLICLIGWGWGGGEAGDLAAGAALADGEEDGRLLDVVLAEGVLVLQLPPRVHQPLPLRRRLREGGQRGARGRGRQEDDGRTTGSEAEGLGAGQRRGGRPGVRGVGRRAGRLAGGGGWGGGDGGEALGHVDAGARAPGLVREAAELLLDVLDVEVGAAVHRLDVARLALDVERAPLIGVVV